jgi:hypothetical protein
MILQTVEMALWGEIYSLVYKTAASNDVPKEIKEEAERLVKRIQNETAQ